MTALGTFPNKNPIKKTEFKNNCKPVFLVGMNSVKCLAVGFSYGLKDSFLGIFLLSNIDNDQKGKAVEGRPSSKHGVRQSRPDTKRLEMFMFF